MKNRILRGWTLTRFLYLLMGTLIFVQAIMAGQWGGMILGGYILSMGIFAIGCAAGTCTSCVHTHEGKEEVEFEEVKANEKRIL